MVVRAVGSQIEERQDSITSGLEPVIEKVPYSRAFLDHVREWERRDEEDKSGTLLLEYPTVYVVEDNKHGLYDVYVGETGNIKRRTTEHLGLDTKVRDDWAELGNSRTASMYVVGHELFNKSLTLDVENKLMLYMTGLDHVRRLNNRRTNAQRNYYTQEHFDEIFDSIWRGLRQRDKKLFPDVEVIRNSALFKASPFHKLTDEQQRAKQQILDRAMQLLREETADGELILVKGEAGAGKTVLLSSLFYEFFQAQDEDESPFSFQNYDAYMLVNHKEQLTVYQEIAKKLGIEKREGERVFKPSTFINLMKNNGSKADVVLVDEAHLLLTQGNQGYRGKNQLRDLLSIAKLVIVIFDKKQIMAANQHWEPDELLNLEVRAGAGNIIELKNQIRMQAATSTVSWVKSIVEEGILRQLPKDDKGYDLQVFDSASAMHRKIKERAQDQSRGLSRIVATYDWYWHSKAPEGGGTWNVTIGDFSLPWNNELKRHFTRSQTSAIANKAWAEQEHTIDEVGSTHVIQGFDLNYVGVILGPSVKFRNGRVVHDPLETSNKSAARRRTLASGEKKSLVENLLKNELNVLLTRGVKGLYIYAVDDALREALAEAVGGFHG